MRTLGIATALLVLSLAVVVPATVGGEPGEEASIDRIEAWQAPANETDFEDADDVRSAIDSDTLSRATGVSGEDVLVVELELRGFDDALATAGGSTTERLRAVLAEHGDLVIRQTNMGPEVAPATIDALEESGVTVFPDTVNDTYYVAIDLEETATSRGDTREELETDRTYRFDVRAELAADSPLTADGDVAGTAVAPRSARVETERDGRLQFRPQSNQTVSGTTNLGTGSTVTLVLAGESNPGTDTDESFRLTREVTVDGPVDGYGYEGQFAGAFDLREVSPAARNVTLDVRKDGQSVVEHPIPTVVADRRATVTADGTVENGECIGVTATTTLSAGGFLVVHRETADGPVVGHSPYLERGDHTVTVYLDEPTTADELVVVAYRDADYNEWFDGVDTETAYEAGAPEDAIPFASDRSDDTTPGDVQSGSETTAPAPATGGTTTADVGPGTPTVSDGGDSGPTPPIDIPTGSALPLVGVMALAVLLVAVTQLRVD